MTIVMTMVVVVALVMAIVAAITSVVVMVLVAVVKTTMGAQVAIPEPEEIIHDCGKADDGNAYPKYFNRSQRARRRVDQALLD